MGYEVLIPIGDRMQYDLVFDDGNKLYRVQVKYAGKSSRGKYVAYLRITGGNQSFNYARKYKEEDFDYLYIFTADERHFLMKWGKIKARNTISLDYFEYQKYQV